jgi:hypothetical protein
MLERSLARRATARRHFQTTRDPSVKLGGFVYRRSEFRFASRSQGRAPRQAARTHRRVVRRRSASRDGPSEPSGGSEPPPALVGSWEYLALASSRMREHERRREARWRVAA